MIRNTGSPDVSRLRPPDRGFSGRPILTWWNLLYPQPGPSSLPSLPWSDEQQCKDDEGARAPTARQRQQQHLYKNVRDSQLHQASRSLYDGVQEMPEKGNEYVHQVGTPSTRVPAAPRWSVNCTACQLFTSVTLCMHPTQFTNAPMQLCTNAPTHSFTRVFGMREQEPCL